MAINFLQGIGAPPMQAPSMPVEQAAPPMPVYAGNLQQMTAGAPDTARLANLLQALGGGVAAQPQAQQAPVPEAPRKRRSFLETLGRVSDVIAQVGGADPLYQPTLDAREDRARQIDLQGLQRQLAEQQIAQGGQTIKAGEIELVDSERGRLAQALGAVANNPDAAALWPHIAAQAGISEERAAQIGGLIQQNPKLAGALAQSLGYVPSAKGQGSQAKELQIYGMLLENGTPEMAQAYLQSLTNPDAMTEYQRAQLALAQREFNLKVDSEEFDRGIETEKLDIKRNSGEGGEDSSSVASILQDFGVRLDGKSDPVADLIRGSTSGYAENIASMVPGAFGVATDGQKKIAQLKTIDNALVLALAGGKLGAGVSNADRDFFKEMSGMISDPNTPADARLAAWGQIKQRLRGIVARETKKPAARPAARRKSGSAPAAAPAARRSMSPAAIEARRRGLID